MRNFILVVLAVVALAGVTAAQDRAEFALVKAAWEKRVAETAAARGVLVVKRILPKLAKSKTLNDTFTSDVLLTFRIEFSIDYSTGRFRMSTDGTEYDSATKQIVPKQASRAFDGSVYRTAKYPQKGKTNVGTSDGTAADLAEIRGNLERHPFDSLLLPVCYFSGRLPIKGDHRLIPGRPDEWHDFPDWEEFMSHSRQNRTTNQVLWAAVAPIKMGSNAVTSEVALLREADFALKQLTISANSKAKQDYILEYQGKTLVGWRATHRLAQSGQAFQIDEVRVESLEINRPLPPDDFMVRPVAGMIVAKIESPADLDSTKDLDLTRFVAQENGALVPYQDSTTAASGVRQWIRALVSCAVTGVLLLLVVRHTRNRLRHVR